MRSIAFVLFAACTAVAPPAVAQVPKVARIAYLAPGAESGNPDWLNAFRDELRRLGYVEGRNVSFDVRFADGVFARLPGLAEELIARNPDIIVAVATPAISAAQKTGTRIPIVMSPVTDPVGSGFVASLARPGANITGVANMSVDFSGKSVELLHTVLPKARRIAVLRTSNVSHDAQLKEVQDAAAALRLTVVPILATQPSEIDATGAIAAKNKCDALLVLGDPMLLSNRQRIAVLAAAARLPAVYQYRDHVDAGGLISYGSNLPGLFRQAAVYVDKILKGANPATMPIEQAAKFELVVNLKTAKALGITIPASVLQRADSIIAE